MSDRTATAGGAKPRRLNWGCGSHTARGWINSDVKSDPGVDLVCDIRLALPLDDDSIEYAVSIHALPELAYPELVPALRELWRVLEPGGVLRLGLPDLQRGIRAYLSQRDDYFKVDPGEVRSHGGRFILHMLWYGYSRSLFTYDFTEELLEQAGFVEIVECVHGTTHSPFPEIVELDNREEESFFVEARKPRQVGAVARRRASAGEPYNDGVPRGERIKVLDVTSVEGGTEEVRACKLDFPIAGTQTDDSSLRIVGWAVGGQAPIEAVEVLASGEVVATSPLNVERPGVAEGFKGMEGADRAGFSLTVQGSGEGSHRLAVNAVLADGTKVPIGAIAVEIARPGFFSSRFGRLRNR